MTDRSPFARFVALVFSAVAAIGLLFANASAQTSATGRVQGRVFNPATGDFVRNAEIRLVGTNRVAYSEDGGYYQLDNVPVGNAALQVAFTEIGRAHV